MIIQKNLLQYSLKTRRHLSNISRINSYWYVVQSCRIKMFMHVISRLWLQLIQEPLSIKNEDIDVSHKDSLFHMMLGWRVVPTCIVCNYQWQLSISLMTVNGIRQQIDNLMTSDLLYLFYSLCETASFHMVDQMLALEPYDL